MAGLIDEDILSIGSAKWNRQFQSSYDFSPAPFTPDSFMLPAAENVSHGKSPPGIIPQNNILM